jgi:type IV fimbrial biogenesis protein FimT
MRRRQDSGFTLIELMVTVMVGVVLIGLAVPSFRDMMDKSRLRGATDDIVNLLNMARANAVKLQRDVNVSIFPVNSTTWCAGAAGALSPTTIGNPVPGASACDCTSSTACKVGTDLATVSSSDHSGVTLTTINGSIKYQTGAAGEGIEFNSKAGAIDLGSLPSGALVVVKSPNGKYSTQISISLLGQTHVCVKDSKFISGYPTC